MSEQTPSDLEALEQRVSELEASVKEIGNVVYDMFTELQANGNINALPIPVCPPICPRD
ncbi:MAG: hypothetical protein WCF57_16705 [Pyrinomonadaceae bacterium]